MNPVLKPAMKPVMKTALMLASIALLAGTASAANAQRPNHTGPERPICQKPAQPVGWCGTPGVMQQTPKVEVVFVLDTTGSMGGLIESAKEKIWSIATAIAQAQPSPEIRMGLVAYRDRGDDYVTKRTPMTEDLDALYSELSGYEARGGGDGPESVNQAIFEAVERFDWSEGDNVLRIVYLVGDAPPKMNFDDDVKHPATCRLAREMGILINTIQCGSMGGTREVWQTIAQNANGAFAAIPQDGGTRSITTPYDEEIRKLDQRLSALMVDYGDQEVRAYQSAKRDRSATISESAAPEAAADRAMYNQSTAGRSNLYGRQELVEDVVSGGLSLDEVPAEHLPAELQGLTKEELSERIAANQAERDSIATRLGELAVSRRDFKAKVAVSGDKGGFDAEVVAILAGQAARIGLDIQPKE